MWWKWTVIKLWPWQRVVVEWQSTREECNEIWTSIQPTSHSCCMSPPYHLINYNTHMRMYNSKQVVSITMSAIPKTAVHLVMSLASRVYFLRCACQQHGQLLGSFACRSRHHPIVCICHRRIGLVSVAGDHRVKVARGSHEAHAQQECLAGSLMRVANRGWVRKKRVKLVDKMDTGTRVGPHRTNCIPYWHVAQSPTAPSFRIERLRVHPKLRKAGSAPSYDPSAGMYPR